MITRWRTMPLWALLVRRYRVFAFDGTLSQAEADALWKVFAQR